MLRFVSSLLLVFSSWLQAVEIFTASPNGDYYALVQKAAHDCPIPLAPVVTKGSLDNIKRVLHAKREAYAIVQGDVLEFFKKIAEKKDIQKIVFVKKLKNYTEAIYAIKNAKDENTTKITKIDGTLKKRRKFKDIAVGTFGSGSSITAYNILTPLELSPWMRFITKEDALDALLDKDIFLIIYVAKYDRKRRKVAKWIENIFARYGEKLAMIDIQPKDAAWYGERVRYGAHELVLIPTYFISTDNNTTKNLELYRCLDR